MPRIKEADRLPMINAHIGHWPEAEIIAGAAIVLDGPYGLPELIAQRNQFVSLGDDVLLILQTTLPNLRSQRDGIWGIDSEDINGVWIRLTQYKKRVATLFGALHPLARTVPNIGDVAIERYVPIIHRFLNHWALVNAARPTPMVLGTFTIAQLQTAHNSLHTIMEDIDAKEELARLKNAQQEFLFGDVADKKRDLGSIIAKLTLFHSEIETRFLGQPIAASLPQIFPPGSAAVLPEFEFNAIQQPGAVVKIIYNPPDPALVEAELVFLKEGAVEQTQPVTSTTPGDTQVHLFSGVTLVGDLDELELRNGDGITIARGVRNPSLPEPAGP